jgi:prepilin-type N-terminal cleavage/methylation domain-containing protein
MVKRQAGLSLIELMVTVAIIGMLAVVTVPFTSVWLDEAAVNNARSQLHRAHAQAKAVALRNPTAKELSEVAASVKLSGNVLLVCEGAPNGAGCAVDGNTVVWEGAWPAAVEVDVTEIRINNRGQVLSDGSPVHNGLTYSLSKGKVTTGDNKEHNRLR